MDRIASVAWATAEAIGRTNVPFRLHLLADGVGAALASQTSNAATRMQAILRARHPRCGAADVERPEVVREIRARQQERGFPRDAPLAPWGDELHHEAEGGRAEPASLAARVHRWCVSEGVQRDTLLRRQRAERSPSNGLQGLLQNSTGHIVLFTDLSNDLTGGGLPFPSYLQTGALRPLEIVDCPPPEPKHSPITEAQDSRRQRVHACLLEERRALADDVVEDLRARGVHVHRTMPEHEKRGYI